MCFQVLGMHVCEYNSFDPSISITFNDADLFLYNVQQDIQVTLREEIKSACEYRPFEKCDYIARISNEICCKKVEYVLEKLDGMKETIDEYHQAT